MKEIDSKTLQGNVKFCQAPSQAYLKMLEECGGDPRSVIARKAIGQAGFYAERGWRPSWDSREAK